MSKKDVAKLVLALLVLALLVVCGLVVCCMKLRGNVHCWTQQNDWMLMCYWAGAWILPGILPDILKDCECKPNVADDFIPDESGLPISDCHTAYQIRKSTVIDVQTLKWNEYDLKMEISRDAISDVIDDEFKISINVFKSRHFQFPSGTKPVSAVYGIQTISSFSEPVTVEIEHCCEINTFTSGSLVFAVVNDASRPPYKFEKLEGGIFREGHHGRITTAIAGSSLLVILLKQQANTRLPAIGYVAYFLYQDKNSSTRKVWHIHIAVVQNTKASKQSVTREYPPPIWKEDGKVNFKSAKEEIYFGWSRNSILSEDGCLELIGKTPDQISREDVIHKGLDHVQCSLIDTGACSGVLKYTFDLNGTQDSCYYTLTLEKSEKIGPPTVGCTGISKKQHLEKAVANIGDWETLCEYIGAPKPVINKLHHSDQQNGRKKSECLEAYFNLGEGRACWEQVAEVVASHPFHDVRLAKQIADKYGLDFSVDSILNDVSS